MKLKQILTVVYLILNILVFSIGTWQGLINYPAWALVGDAEFPMLHQAISQRTLSLFLPFFLLSVPLNFAMIWLRPPVLSRNPVILVAVLNLAIFIVTITLMLPIQEQLDQHRSVALLEKLVRYHLYLRTLPGMVVLLTVAAMLYQVMRKTEAPNDLPKLKSNSPVKKILPLIASLCLFSLPAFAQNDKASIEKQVDALFADWNSHAFKNMSNYTTDDVEWINIVGMRWKGRQEVQMAHQAIFDAMFNKVPFRKEDLTIRMLTNDVAIAYLVCHVGEFFPPDGMDHGGNKMPEADDALTLVYVKKGGKWLLTSGQNTVVDARAQESDPAKK